MDQRTLYAALFLVAFALGATRSTCAAEGRAGYYDDKERGWYWRESPPLPPKKPPIRPKPMGGSGMPADPAESVPLTAAWFRANLDRYKDAAVDNPTPDNVERYQLLQRYAMDKADRFSQVWMSVVNSNPALDESNERPLTALQKRTVNAVVSKARREVLARLGEQVGIWYFYRHDCPFCLKQNEPLESVRRQFGFRLLPIALDGLPMPDGSHPDFVADSGQAAKLGISVTPTLVLFRPPSTFEKLSVGLKTSDDIEDMILDTAKRAGWLSEADYIEATRGIAPTYLVDRLSGEGLDDDPDTLLTALRRATVGIGGGTPWVDKQ